MYSHSGAVVVWMVGTEQGPTRTFVPSAVGQADCEDLATPPAAPPRVFVFWRRLLACVVLGLTRFRAIGVVPAPSQTASTTPAPR